MPKFESPLKKLQTDALQGMLGTSYNVTEAARVACLDYQQFRRALKYDVSTVLGTEIVTRLCDWRKVAPDVREKLLQLTVQAQSAPGIEVLPRRVRLDGRIVFKCYACGDEQGFTPGKAPTFCKAVNCGLGSAWSPQQHDIRVTHVLDWKDKVDLVRLPSIDENLDLFPRMAPFDEEPQIYAPERGHSFESEQYARSLLPYNSDWLADHGLACGSPVVYQSSRVRTWLHGEPSSVNVIDFGGYNWSKTLKDPRSWAILNTAIESKKRNLCVWTAGNAGWSLAMMAAAANRFLPSQDRISVHACYDTLDPLIPAALAHWGAQTIKMNVPPGKGVVTPNQVLHHVQGSIVTDWHDADYWDVTDAWDAVGMLTYRLIFCQVISQLRPTHIVVPVGTGNLLMGILKAAQDCRSYPVKIVAAVAKEDNVFHDIHRAQANMGLSGRSGAKSEESHVMSKIAGTYSALLPCLEEAARGGEAGPAVTTLEVDMMSLRDAGLMLSGPGRGLPIVSEPSSMAAFAVLHELCHREPTADMRLLVVNTGSGLLSAKERAFIKGLHPIP